MKTICNRNGFKIGAVIMLSTVLSISSFAQKQNPYSAKTADASKIKAKYDFPGEGRNSKNGAGYSANISLLEAKPKKVALVGFYLYDPGTGKSTKAGSTVSSTAWRTSEATAQTQIDGFHDAGIESLVQSFKENGIDLLTPDQFLDTEQKKEAFYGFNQESGKKEKTDSKLWGKSGVNVSVSSLKICPTDKGYRPFFIVNEKITTADPFNFKTAGVFGANRKMTSSLGYELAKELEVDAVVICYIVTRQPKMRKSDYGVNAVNLYMFGPNPIIKDEDDKNRGQFYCGTRVFYSKPLIFQSEKNGASYDGFDNTMKTMTDKMMEYILKK